MCSYPLYGAMAGLRIQEPLSSFRTTPCRVHCGRLGRGFLAPLSRFAPIRCSLDVRATLPYPTYLADSLKSRFYGHEDASRVPKTVRNAQLSSSPRKDPPIRVKRLFGNALRGLNSFYLSRFTPLFLFPLAFISPFSPHKPRIRRFFSTVRLSEANFFSRIYGG